MQGSGSKTGECYRLAGIEKQKNGVIAPDKCDNPVGFSVDSRNISQLFSRSLVKIYCIKSSLLCSSNTY